MSVEGYKWAAVGLMVVDHLAFMADPHHPVRYLTRAVFPAFAVLLAWHLAQGVDKRKYLIRLAIFGVLAQGGYALAFGGPLVWPLNVLWTFLSGVLLTLGGVWSLAGGVLSLLTEYPFGGFAVALLAEAFRRGLWEFLVGGVFLNAMNLFLFGWPPVAVGVGALATLVFYGVVPRLQPGRRVPWWVFYAFYAGHLWLLGRVKWLGVFWP